MNVSWHGQSCVKIVTNQQQTILIDPLISGNPYSDLDAETVAADVIILTHAHNDHVGDTAAIAHRTGALIIANFELAGYFAKRDYQTHGMQPGGQFSFYFGTLKLTPAIHSSSYEDEHGQVHPLGIAAGLILTIDDKVIYHAGDTALFTDMTLIGQQHAIDLAFLPIGDNFTMGPADAAIAASWLKAKKVVPVHYNTFPVIEQDPQDFFKLLPEEQGLPVAIGETIDL
ncbi:metal-dependent hydrolase [uncultured Vagococcus sp.]|uniref:metal-dependent hydrolase n=1 Tax=uncultured Vagococcus sp. TaxID=189676 RepID=UPI0028D1A1F3|nr:metal-dependent hydrolase [uncultured Vagococcus sp.]